MSRISFLLIFVGAFAFNTLVNAADPMDALVGEWHSTDGTSKQTIQREMGGSWLSTRMWFKAPDGWDLVATGGMYSKPGSSDWKSASRTQNMNGIVLFESMITPVSEGVFAVRNIAYIKDGTPMETEEEWRINKAGEFNYTIFKTEDENRTPWYQGGWVKQQAVEANGQVESERES